MSGPTWALSGPGAVTAESIVQAPADPTLMWTGPTPSTQSPSARPRVQRAAVGGVRAYGEDVIDLDSYQDDLDGLLEQM